MSGVYGIAHNDRFITQTFLQQASTRLAHHTWNVTDTWTADESAVGLGRIGIHTFNREPQPLVSQSGRLTLFMTGELYNTTALRQRLGSRFATQADLSDAFIVLSAFEQFGEDFAKQLNGAFFIAIHDAETNRLILANDRFGLYPHYYYCHDGALVFAPEVKGVLCAPFVPSSLNLDAVAEFLRFQHLLGTKTFHEDIHLFPYASIAVLDLNSGKWTLRNYWNWDQIPDNSHIKFEEATRETGRLMQAAVHQLSSDNLRPGVFLSGGLDSRSILGMMPPRKPPIVSATFGAAQSRDVYYAERIAATVGSDHHWFNLPEDGSWVKDYLDLHFQLTEGFHSWIHMHGMSMLPTLRGLIDYYLSGWDGGTLMGDNDLVNRKYNAPVNFSTLLTDSFYDFNQRFTWPGLTEAEELLLYNPNMLKQMSGRAFESFRNEFMPFWNFRHDYAHEFFYLTNHCLRMTVNMITFARSHMEVRFPFWDYDLLDFVFSLKPEIRQEKQMYRHMITQFMPQLANIPYDKQEFLPTSHELKRRSHALSVKISRRLHLFPERPTLYADYEQYMRRSLRTWSEDLLREPLLVDKGIIDSKYLKDLLDRHMDGHELWTIGKISPVMTLEMVMREFFD